jgi:ubiquinone/menaquinone biosynthesis C-methylase UbiE
MATANSSRKNYMLATGDEAANRLQLLNQIFGSSTRELLNLAGLALGMRVAEIGCGAGLVALSMAEAVGKDGSVAAVDMSAEQLRVAEANAAAAGLKNLSFHAANACDTGLPRASFDLVYSRFLMCHLTEPVKALAEMRALLKPGGILVCEDHDDGGIFSEPPTRAYKRLVEISEAVNRARGLDSYVGLKLPRLVREAGFATPELLVKQIALLRGQAKRFWEITLREAAPAIFAAGASTPEDLESICAEMQTIAKDETTLLMLARVTQVWVRH